MSIKTRFALLLATLLFVCGGCRNYDPMQEHNPDLGSYFEDGGHFDFSTIGEVQLDIDYGPGLGAKTFMQIFDQYPDEDVEPLYTTVTDHQGRIQNRTLLPKRVKEVWLVNHHIGMPEYVKCSVANGRIQYKYESPLLKADGVTRAGSAQDNTDYRNRVKSVNESENQSENLFTIVSWSDKYGHVNTEANDGIVSKDESVTTDTYNTYVHNLELALWGGRDPKPSRGLDNNKYALGANIVNTKTLATYTNDEGEEVDVESVSLNFVFLSEWAAWQNTLGYYYYKTEQVPSSPAEVKKFICLPNASKPGHSPYCDTYASTDAPAFAGESISLLFENSDGSFTKNFPPGYTVGYFVYSKGFRSWRVPGYLYTENPYYSNEVWNSDDAKRYLALSLPNGGIVYGLEDGTDNSYDDVLFMIQGTPNEAVHNPGLPTINPENNTILYWDATHQTYAFEDIWPNGGDYDLNDVVIEHERKVEYDNDGKLRVVEDDFMLAETHATYHDAFAIQLNIDWLGSSLTIEKDGEDITSSVKSYTDMNNSNAKTYILFEDLQQLTVGTKFKVTRMFTNNLERASFENAEPMVNPFVISKYTEADYEAGSMVEIHIPNFGNRTCKATTSNSTGSEYYYVARNGDRTYPFALCLPVRKFNASPEGVCIDETYPEFNDWVKSNGEKNKDWYLHRSTESK